MPLLALWLAKSLLLNRVHCRASQPLVQALRVSSNPWIAQQLCAVQTLHLEDGGATKAAQGSLSSLRRQPLRRIARKPPSERVLQ